MTANTQTFVNTANTVTFRAGFGVSLTYKKPTISGFANLFSKEVQTTPQTSRGYMPGSAIDVMNNNLVHDCDLKFLANFGISLGDLTAIIGSIGNAIKNAKNAAAAKIRSLFGTIIDAIHLALDAISTALSFDFTGQFSLTVGLTKKLLAKIKYYVDKIAQAIEDVLTWVYFAQDIIALLKWIESLPEQIKQMFLGCLNQFKNSLNQIQTQIKSIPGTATSVVTGITNSITSQVSSTISSLNGSLQGVTSTSSDFSNLLANPQSSTANATLIIQTANEQATSSLKPTTATNMANTSGP